MITHKLETDFKQPHAWVWTRNHKNEFSISSSTRMKIHLYRGKRGQGGEEEIK